MMKKLLFLSSVFVVGTCLAKPAPKRVLFIGNSYTSQIRKTFLGILSNSPSRDTQCEFVTRGGATLKQHLANPDVAEKIKTGKWDFVVLQEQSQTPALPGEYEPSFQRSVDQFSALIKEAGAEPVLYMTWGRRDGDSRNKELLPDYSAMQKRLTSAYRSAAERNGITVAPVGEVWSAVCAKSKTLGGDLYKKDGSHPSEKGAFLVSCTFMRVLFGNDLKEIKPPAGVSSEDAQLIRDNVGLITRPMVP